MKHKVFDKNFIDYMSMATFACAMLEQADNSKDIAHYQRNYDMTKNQLYKYYQIDSHQPAAVLNSVEATKRAKALATEVNCLSIRFNQALNNKITLNITKDPEAVLFHSIISSGRYPVFLTLVHDISKDIKTFIGIKPDKVR